MPKESPPGPDSSLMELEAIARAEARRSPGLAPNGGRRWTSEDIAFAVSVLGAIARTDAFRQVSSRGLDGRRRPRGYLLAALHYELVRARLRAARMVLLDDLDLDTLPTRRGGTDRLAKVDVLLLGREILGRLSPEQTQEFARRIHRQGTGAVVPTPCQRPSMRTRVRQWAKVRGVLLAVAREGELTREEMGEILAVLAVKVAGWGKIPEDSGNP